MGRPQHRLDLQRFRQADARRRGRQIFAVGRDPSKTRASIERQRLRRPNPGLQHQSIEPEIARFGFEAIEQRPPDAFAPQVSRDVHPLQLSDPRAQLPRQLGITDATQCTASDWAPLPPCDDENSVAGSDFIRVEAEVGGARLRVISGEISVELPNERRRHGAGQRFGRDSEWIGPNVVGHGFAQLYTATSDRRARRGGAGREIGVGFTDRRVRASYAARAASTSSRWAPDQSTRPRTS